MNNTPKVDIIYDHKNETKNNPEAYGTVSIRIYYQRKRNYFTTGIRVPRKEWSQKWLCTGPNCAHQNKVIKAKLDEITNKIKASSLQIMPKQLRTNSNKATFLDFIRKELDIADLAPGTRRHHEVILDMLEENSLMLRFEHVTAANVTKYLTIAKQRGISATTLRTYYTRLAKWIHLAQDKCLVSADALKGVHVPRGTSKLREHLTQKELDKWIKLDFKTRYLEHARDMFALQCATGLAYSDLFETDFKRVEKHDDFLTLSGRRKKTEKDFFLVILPFALPILEKYGYKLTPISNQNYNEYLHQVARLADINKNITSHVGRHTYATLCLSKGVRIEAVSRALGHTNIKTTQIYAKLVDNDVLEAFKKMKK